MTIVRLSTHTYELLSRRARQINRSPDAVAEEVLHRELQPEHPYIEVRTSPRGDQAVVREIGMPVSLLVGYIQLGLAPSEFADEIHPALSPAKVYDALSYYYDHREEIDTEVATNTEDMHRQRLAGRMHNEQDLLTITGRRR